MREFKTAMSDFIGGQHVFNSLPVKQKIGRLGDLSKMGYIAVEPDTLQFLNNNKTGGYHDHP